MCFLFLLALKLQRKTQTKFPINVNIDFIKKKIRYFYNSSGNVLKFYKFIQNDYTKNLVFTFTES